MLPKFFKRKRENFLFVLTIIVILVAIIFNLILLPLKNKWQKLNKEILISKAKLGRYRRILMQKDLIKKKYKIYADYLKARSSSEEAVANLLQEIETIATSSGVSLVNIIPSLTEEKDFYKQFNINIELESRISSLIKFIYQIQESRELFKIERLHILAKPAPSGVLKCNIRLSKISIP